MARSRPVGGWQPLRIHQGVPQKCAHLPDRTENRIIIDLRTSSGMEFSEIMLDQGYVRQQHHAVAPACVGCRSCTQIRVPVASWIPTRSQTRAMRRNADLIRREYPPVATPEQFLLFQRYLEHRHPHGGMNAMRYDDYVAMVEDTPLETRIVEWREPDDERGHKGRLVAAMLMDRHDGSLALQYSFYEPWSTSRGLGTFMICDMIRSCEGTAFHHVHLGTFMATSPKLAYKARFAPYELLDRARWWSAE